MNDAAIAHVLRTTADPYPHPDYAVCRTPNDLYDYFAPDPNADRDVPSHLACDTESTPTGAPFCVTFSSYPGTARLIYTRDTELIKILESEICIYGLAKPHEYIHLLFHNYLHDVEYFEQLNLPVDGPFTDTMVRAYNLCLGGGNDEESSGAGKGSLSLKALAHRLCHMSMRSFTDTVYPHSTPYLRSWLELGQSMLTPPPPPSPVCANCGHPQLIHEVRGKQDRNIGPCWHPGCGSCTRFRKAKVVKEPGDKATTLLYRKINLLLNDMKTKPAVDPWDRVKDWYKAAREEDATPGALAALDELVSVFGPHPVPSIEHVPEEELVWYACRDADATLRLYHILKDYQPWVFYD